MSKYVIYLTTEASVSVEVEADSLEEAQDMAYESEGFGSVCAQCSGWGRDWSLDFGEFEVDEKQYSVDGDWVEVKQS